MKKKPTFKTKKFKCLSCKKSVLKSITVYDFIYVVDEKEIYTIGIKKLLDSLNTYAFNKGYHLSGSELLLLRHDIVKQYFKEIRLKNVTRMGLKPSQMCKSCHEVYCEYFPLK